jgi:hypothetical protein
VRLHDADRLRPAAVRGDHVLGAQLAAEIGDDAQHLAGHGDRRRLDPRRFERLERQRRPLGRRARLEQLQKRKSSPT